jgi:hypothetical protein
VGGLGLGVGGLGGGGVGCRVRSHLKLSVGVVEAEKALVTRLEQRLGFRV